jgi:hypothetical protein
MTSPAPSYEQQYREEIKARRRRLFRPHNAVRERKGNILAVVPVADISYVEPPQWKTKRIMFDAHVMTWRNSVDERLTSKYKAFILQRCQDMNVRFEKIVYGRARSVARNQIFYELRTQFTPPPTYEEIGRIFNDRHHTTIVKAVQQHVKIANSPNPHSMCVSEMLMRDEALVTRIKYSFDTGILIQNIASSEGLKIDGLRKFIKSQGWKREISRPSNFRRPEVVIEAVKSAYINGVPIKRISIEHNIPERTIGTYRKRFGWPKRSDRAAGI